MQGKMLSDEFTIYCAISANLLLITCASFCIQWNNNVQQQQCTRAQNAPCQWKISWVNDSVTRSEHGVLFIDVGELKYEIWEKTRTHTQTDIGLWIAMGEIFGKTNITAMWSPSIDVDCIEFSHIHRDNFSQSSNLHKIHLEIIYTATFAQSKRMK